MTGHSVVATPVRSATFIQGIVLNREKEPSLNNTHKNKYNSVDEMKIFQRVLKGT
jgi:hypothetical protein